MPTFRPTRGASPFQSTLSVRRATKYLNFFKFFIRISIHALREESDCTVLQ